MGRPPQVEGLHANLRGALIVYTSDMAVTDNMMKRCPLSRWAGDTSRCRWCNKELTGRQRRWCSVFCGDEAFTEHNFSWAKIRVLSRDSKTCVKCSRKEGKSLSGPPVKIEVNHKKAALGTHNKASCAHHTSNLECLCRECHLEVTAAQRKAGLFDRKFKGGKLRPLS